MKNSAIAFFLSIILLTTFSLEAKKADALVRKLKGYAEYSEPGSETFKPLRVSKRIKAGSTIKTSEDSEVIVRVVPGAAMKIAENTTVALDAMEYEKNGKKISKRKANINLSAGTVSALLDKGDPKGTDFKIKTPQGSAAARGTFYGVSVKDGQTYVSVEEGKVGIVENTEESQKEE